MPETVEHSDQFEPERPYYTCKHQEKESLARVRDNLARAGWMMSAEEVDGLLIQLVRHGDSTYV